MNKFAKITLLVSAIVLVVGIAVAMIGVFSGAKLSYSEADARQVSQGTVFYQIFD